MKICKKKIALGLSLVLVTASIAAPSTESQAAKMKLNRSSATITVGKKVTLKVRGTKKKVKWTTSKKAIASVSQKGVVTGKKAGKATITAKVGKKKFRCKVKVKAKKTAKKVTPTPVTTPASTMPGTNGINNSTGQVQQTAAPSVTNEQQNSEDDSKKVTSITWSSYGRKYVFLQKGEKLVDNQNQGSEDNEVDIGHFNLQFVDVQYEDGSEERNKYAENASYDFSQINYEQLGTYNLKITWKQCSCEVPVVISEERQEGLFTYYTDGTVAELTEMRGDIPSADEWEDDEYSGTTLTLPETLGGAKVVQGTPSYKFSCDNIEKIEFPRYYSESSQKMSLQYGSRNSYDEEGDFSNLKEIIINNPDSGYIVKNNVLYAENGKTLCLYPAGLQNTSYSIPEGVKYMTEYAMTSNQYLQEIAYPKSFIGSVNGFYLDLGECLRNLEKIDVEKDNPYWVSIDGVMYGKDDDDELSLRVYPRKKKDTSFTVSANVSSITTGAMCVNDFLENITFKSGYTSLETNALGCSIKNIYLDFEEEDGSGSNYLYITSYKFSNKYGGEVEDFEEDCQLSHIYIRNGVSLDHMSKYMQKKVQYY